MKNFWLIYIKKKLNEFDLIIENLAKTFFKYMNYLKENSRKIKIFMEQEIFIIQSNNLVFY